MSIPGVDGCLGGGRSAAGGVPLPPPIFGPTVGLIAGGEGSDRLFGAKTCCARGDEVMPPCLAVVGRGPRKGLWGEDGPEGADVFTEVGPAPGVERPD